jgi:hypothetical protein
MREKLKVAEGALADLKVGQQVSVTCAEEDARATKVFIHRSAPPKRNTEGDSERPKRAPETDPRPRPVEK